MSKTRSATGVGINRSERPIPPNSARELFDDFVNSTTLIGIPHIIKKRSLMWFIAYVVCLSLSILQSSQSAIHFLEQKSHQSSSVQNMMDIPWPTITFCNDVVLNSSFVNKNNIPNYVDQDFNTCAINDTEYEIQANNTLQVMRYVRSRLKETNYLDSVDLTSWVKNCRFDNHDCSYSNGSLFYKFNNPLDGNCFSFNPAFNENGVEIDIISKLMITFGLKRNGYQIGGGKRRISLLLHSPGTTPLMDLPDAINVFDGQNVKLGLKLNQKDFMLKARTKNPTCVLNSPTSKRYHMKNLYYTERTPYVYSVAACMKTCKQVVLNNPCGWLEASFPILNETYERLEPHLSPFDCQITTNLSISTEECDCPFPCLYRQYPYTLDTTFLPEETDECLRKQESPSDLKMRVEVQFLTSIYDYDKEVLDYNLTAFLGFLGGNLSLWLGFCILSFLEVFELIWHLIALKLRQKLHAEDVASSPQLYEIKRENIPKLLNCRPNLIRRRIRDILEKRKM